MENYVIEQDFGDELQHWGIKGQKWGQRRYQNKDGSLTPAGQKRYNKEVEKLKQEKAKVKAAEKVLANKKKTQAKIDKLEADKKALEDRKNALKEEKRGGKKSSGKDNKNTTPEETFESRREKALKTSDPNELYKNRDTLSDTELRERINRINTEQTLANMAASTQKTGMDSINKALAYARKADEIYKFAIGSQAGKDLMKAIGLKANEEKSYKWKNLDDFYENIDKMSAKDVEEGAKRAQNMFKAMNAKKQVDDYNAEKAKKIKDAQKKAEEAFEETRGKHREADKSKGGKTDEPEKFSGDVEGEGTSRSSIKEDWERKYGRSTVDDFSEATIDKGRKLIDMHGPRIIYDDDDWW